MSEKGIVLLVEDDTVILNINRRILEKDGLMVLTAKTLAETRERLKIATPNVVVLDIIMPDGNGLDFFTELRQVCSAPVIFLSSKKAPDEVLAGLVAGGNDYITKPYNIDEFRARVLNFLHYEEYVKVSLSHGTPDTTISSVLTEKELAIALLTAEGHSNKDTANKVSLSESHVKNSLSNIYRKLGIQDKDNKRELLTELLNR
jgi:DNA-binding NarL/FixJ family response regulator